MPPDQPPTQRNGSLPDYAESLNHFHQAFQREIVALIDRLPLRSSDAVLDVPCGDGFFTHLLAQHLGRKGRLVGLDHSENYLQIARQHPSGVGATITPSFTQGDIYRLPFADGAFQLVWCAQSLISLPNALDALCEMHRVLRPGGVIALLEEDAFHNLILPWPPEIELAFQRAFHRASQRKYGNAGKLYYGRRLRRLLKAARLPPWKKKTLAWDRMAPLDEKNRRFFADYLHHLWHTVAPVCDATTYEQLGRRLDPAAPGYLLDQPDFEATYLGMLYLGRKGL